MWRGLLTLLVTLPVLLVVGVVYVLIGHKSDFNQIMSLLQLVRDSHNVTALAVFFFLVAILAPLTEEIVVRGFIFRALRQTNEF